MENVLSIFTHVNEKINEFAESNKPQWATSQSFLIARRYAQAYMKNENWLNSIEALMKRYGINQNENL
jgi:hypothetical protein